MLNNFTGGGQVFLHKIRMLTQVLSRSLMMSTLVSSIIIIAVSIEPSKQLDIAASITYQKALIADSYDEASSGIREAINQSSKYYYTRIDAYDKDGLYSKDVDPRVIIKSLYFKKSYVNSLAFLKQRMMMLCVTIMVIFFVIYVMWSRFGITLKTEKAKDGKDRVLNEKEIKRQLYKIGKASDLRVGKMPLVKDSETMHLLVTGSTGSGKTNLIHNLLPQVEAKGQPVVVVDQTGEMISKYYNKKRGDIIFNPFDSRSHAWDLFEDCSNIEELERFSKILFSFNRKKSSSQSDPFWEQSAEVVFNECMQYLTKERLTSARELKTMVQDADLEYLQSALAGTQADRYLSGKAKNIAESVLSVLATNSKPIKYLNDFSTNGSFSLKEHFSKTQEGSNAWLFLATKPSSRELTLPLIACLLELSFAQLMEIGINKNRRVWFVVDELAALGRLPALQAIMNEGRKYGACVLAGLQSLNQIYDHYGHYAGSSLFGQFGTSFFFKNKEPSIAKMVSSMCGTETITRQQKNTSFGANEFRDGVSYNEHQQRKDLVEYSDLANLATGECYILMPEVSTRVGKIQAPEAKLKNKNKGFEAIVKEESEVESSRNSSANNNIKSSNKEQKEAVEAIVESEAEESGNNKLNNSSSSQKSKEQDYPESEHPEERENTNIQKNKKKLDKGSEELEFCIN